MEYHNKKVIVLGMGKTGVAVSSFLCDRGAKVFEFDDHLSFDVKEDLFCEGYDFAVISPGVALSNRAVVKLKENGVPVLSEIDLAYINCPSKHIFAVSGTNGKTTTCHILHKMLSAVGRCHLVGNIGTPFIGEIDKIGKKDSVVLEMSSFQIEQSGLFRPQIAALTNVGEDHLDRHANRDVYRNIKLSLLEKAQVGVVNADDPVQRKLLGAIRYSLSDQAAEYCLVDRTIRCRGREYRLPERSLGKGYDLDYLCAFAVAATYCGVKKAFLSLYDKVKLPPYRCQEVGKLCGATVINDSKGTNIDATLFAIGLLSDRAALILGGSDKGEDYHRLMRGLGEKTERVYLIGANSGEMYYAAEEEVRKKCLLMSDLESCVRDFAQNPLPVLLFSPASASFDRYRNYEERGRCFNEIVQRYRETYGE